MKPKLFSIAVLVAVLTSCDTPALLESKDYSFFIFRYTDEANKEWIITTTIAGSAGVLNSPKRYRNEPYFGRSRRAQNPEKYKFDICELATEEKLLYLHDGYRAYFPYTSIHFSDNDVYRDGKWKDICKRNPLDLPVKGSANGLYKEVRHFDIYALEKMTGKGRKEMSIEDIETAINKAIDAGKLDKYSTKVSGMWPSYE